MAQANSNRLISLSSVHVSTTYAKVFTPIGMRGQMMPIAGDKMGLKVYRDLSSLQDDYDIDTPVWNQANAYFSGAPDGAFFALTYDKNAVAQQKPTLDGATATDNSVSVALSSTQTKGGLLDALSKYFYAGSEYIVMPIMTDEDKATALTVSNFVEAQDRGILVLSLTTPAGRLAVADDFAFLEQIKDNRATKVVSLPSDLDEVNALGSDTVGHIVGDPVGSNLKFVGDLGETPQNIYDFTNADLAPYEKYNIATYAYDNGVPVITNGRMMSGIAFSTMLTKDSITNDVISTVSGYLHSNRRVPYADGGVQAIKGLLKGVLGGYVESGLIKSYALNDPDTSAITEEKKASGLLDVFNWTWTAVPTIDQAEFAQTLNVYDGQ